MFKKKAGPQFDSSACSKVSKSPFWDKYPKLF